MFNPGNLGKFLHLFGSTRIGKIGDKLSLLKGQGEAGGLVRVTMSGLGKIEKLELDDKLSGKSLETIEDLVVSACNSAKEDLERKTNEEMMNLRSDPELLAVFARMFNKGPNETN
ncbi:predicted protein [Naegleria gruberi]|uniref:Predicted protein n=1 Tax=Naegleria gruberi TaxID=5762 RepID=D2VHB6_NAEGR|nr:uncharacterized protein NAEGRDRAFT_79937 [Naegleria gruberi]EFC43774.1 predicted protein [Naegleria gruberi]|eukprot:XP_002676518.1 predicted protein [Naegleria gruberi strain NEG-M]